MTQITTKTSPLLRRIKDAVEPLRLKQGRLHISIADDMKWEKSAGGEEVLVRWLCWSIEEDDAEILPPEFEVVGKDVTLERLSKELPSFFPHLEVIIDNDIDA